MTTQNTRTFTKRIALGVAALNIVVMLAGFILRIWFSAYLGWDWLSSASIRLVAIVVYSVIAVLIIVRYPRHTVGWLFLIVGFFLAMVNILNGLQALQPNASFGPFVSLIWWASHLTFLPAFIIPLSLMLLFFPDGRLPSRRWWPIAVAALLGMCGGVSSIAFYPWPWEEIGIPDAHNPFAIAGSEEYLTLLLQLSFILTAIGVFGSLAAVVVRFYRSQGIERLQMKWLVYIAVGGLSSAILLARLFGELISYYLLLALPTLMAIAIGIAILRHRLWDIDVIIRKTVTYSVLTGLLALVYFGSVVLMQQVFRVEGQAQWVTVISTLAIAALFSPLRRHVQDIIDRRFYRRRYDAAKTLAAFATTARDETDLEKLTARLVEVVQETMQPTYVSLWLKGITDRRQERTQ